LQLHVSLGHMSLFTPLHLHCFDYLDEGKPMFFILRTSASNSAARYGEWLKWTHCRCF